MMVKVWLVGGPFDGERRAVDSQRRLLTLEWEDETVEREDGELGCVLYVTRLGIATYRRVDEHRFEYCRTPAALGDSDLDLPKETQDE